MKLREGLAGTTAVDLSTGVDTVKDTSTRGALSEKQATTSGDRAMKTGPELGTGI